MSALGQSRHFDCEPVTSGLTLTPDMASGLHQNDFSNFSAKIPESCSSFCNPSGGGMGWGRGGLIAIVGDGRSTDGIAADVI